MSFSTFQTPARPLPGAFLQTPAQSSNVNRQLFPSRTQSMSAPQPAAPEQHSSNQQPGALVQPTPVPKMTNDPVQRAARTINEMLRRDANYPELDSYVKSKMAGCCLRKSANNNQAVYHPTTILHQIWAQKQHGRHIRRQRCTIFQRRLWINTTTPLL